MRQVDLFSDPAEAGINKQIDELISRGALFILNHSAGKDSQAMTIKVKERVPANQIVVVHAHLRGVEWPGTLEHIKATIADSPLRVAHAVKSFYDMVRHRQMFPSPTTRNCTSDLKRGPLEKLIRQICKDYDNKLIVNCMGLRAEESSFRAKASVFKFSERNSKAGREWYEWLPIHTMLEGEVFQTIKDAGEKPHWAYGAGMSRLSCMFCIYANVSDLRISATHNPVAYAEVVALEKDVGHTLQMPKKGQGPQGLETVTGIEAIPIRVAA